MLQPGPDAGLSSSSENTSPSLTSPARAVLQLWEGSGWSGCQVRAPLQKAGVTHEEAGKCHSEHQKKEAAASTIWLDTDPGYCSLKWTYCREGGLEVTEVLTCSWSEEQEIIGLISSPNTPAISALHHWALSSSLPQPKQEQWGGGCREVAADLGLTPFLAAWQDKVNQATSLLGLGKAPSGENLPKVGKKKFNRFLSAMRHYL